MKQAYHRLTQSAVYKDYLEAHPDNYLVHAFLMKESQYEENWQFGVYDSKTDEVASFIVKKDEIEFHASAEIMKRPEDKLLKLEMDDSFIEEAKAIDLAQEYIEKNFHGQSPKSKILILQNAPGFGSIWNVTIITLTFDAVNLKIDAKTGEIKKADSHSLLDLQNNGGQ